VPRATIRFLLLWTVVTVVIFSLAQTKLPHYISSIYPALALALAMVAEQCRTSRLETWAVLGLLLPVGVLVAALPWIWPLVTQFVHHPRALAVLAQPIAPDWHHAMAALPLLVLLLWLLQRRQVVVLAGVGVALQSALFFGVVPVASALMQGPKLAIAAAIHGLPAATPVLSYNLNAPSISFAARRNYRIVLDAKGRATIAAMQRPYALIMRSESRPQFPLLQSEVPVVNRGGYLLFVRR